MFCATGLSTRAKEVAGLITIIQVQMRAIKEPERLRVTLVGVVVVVVVVVVLVQP